jgi:four helix bundle protein
MKYDLENRTFLFTKNLVLFVKKLPRSITNSEFVKQIVRSAGSVGANYIEANEALSKKDFLMRVKISRKEAKETSYWLRLILETNDEKYATEGSALLREVEELRKILSAIIEKTSTQT